MSNQPKQLISEEFVDAFVLHFWFIWLRKKQLKRFVALKVKNTLKINLKILKTIKRRLFWSKSVLVRQTLSIFWLQSTRFCWFSTRKNYRFFWFFLQIIWKVGQFQLSAKCSEISVPDLYGISNSQYQLSGMYIIFILTENCVSKEHLEHKDCS